MPRSNLPVLFDGDLAIIDPDTLPDVSLPDHPMSRASSFWARVAVGAANECWPWTGSLNGGYGRPMYALKHHYAHRLAYELVVGPIPEGLELDHLCRNRACCNPSHLEPVTHKENALRGENPCAKNARKTECKLGHPLEEIIEGGRRRRRCKICAAAASRREYERRLARKAAA